MGKENLNEIEEDKQNKRDIKEIANDKFKELIEKLQIIQSRFKDKSIRNGRLEKLTEEARKTFDDLAESLREKKNLFKEMIKRRADLRKWKISIFKTFFPIKINLLLSMPFIYGFSLILVIFHLALEIYHQVCFRLFNIPLIKSREYFVFDRQKLPYLNGWEKMNCAYCSYANNLMRYSVEVIGRTERYWCPIKHAENLKQTHSQYSAFVPYLDAQAFREKKKELRDFSDIVELKGE